ncbi:hypothetical protein PHYBLDRAFT_148171 [Phycomyces blakesleeanus NRRL 1555(-)]|uniref:Uncharacterized protein n=1 Tax=Phycomyces blakesleeanus (strain ATCC 8743b / DSM 1359 / FGSC 10004 / NBRC 33097 / NRRL 1555) TaxID=763407 RepID=A0A163A457_PHYB8|nr:hypothetical protein PHYBLDRAFT_148171 [Phycomyces blakesleeanus NRRL 1555(-)]OAD70951.1 hypothetical protein PHYBLDRAFT_148171 [Phycomyces blakesleeanus NRRL 1555(-)]|eukprot:XP_018288991.1 hypothetical protein PHYBLDRAFT_148171 [Phycomyces blakesleeanus NRRL 1555(-)]
MPHHLCFNLPLSNNFSPLHHYGLHTAVLYAFPLTSSSLTLYLAHDRCHLCSSFSNSTLSFFTSLLSTPDLILLNPSNFILLGDFNHLRPP